MDSCQARINNLKMIHLAVFLLLFGTLTGCNQSGENGASTAAKFSGATSAQGSTQATKVNASLEGELMQAVFGKEYNLAKGHAIAELQDVNEPKARTSYLIAPRGHKQLADGRMILVTNSSEEYDENEEPRIAHVTSGILSVFILVKKGTHWQVKKRHENVAQLGSMGEFGELAWVDLGASKPGLIVNHGGTWQGNTISFFALFDLNANHLRDIGGMAIYSGNGGACVEETDKCWEISGKYRFVPNKNQAGYNDLVIDFSGEESTLPTQTGKERVKKAVKGSARYHFNGKKYALIAGKNLVPAI